MSLAIEASPIDRQLVLLQPSKLVQRRVRFVASMKVPNGLDGMCQLMNHIGHEDDLSIVDSNVFFQAMTDLSTRSGVEADPI